MTELVRRPGSFCLSFPLGSTYLEVWIREEGGVGVGIPDGIPPERVTRELLLVTLGEKILEGLREEERIREEKRVREEELKAAGATLYAMRKGEVDAHPVALTLYRPGTKTKAKVMLRSDGRTLIALEEGDARDTDWIKEAAEDRVRYLADEILGGSIREEERKATEEFRRIREFVRSLGSTDEEAMRMWEEWEPHEEEDDDE